MKNERKSENKVLFFLPLINFGEEDVNSAKAELTIMDMDENIIAPFLLGIFMVKHFFAAIQLLYFYL